MRGWKGFTIEAARTLWRWRKNLVILGLVVALVLVGSRGPAPGGGWVMETYRAPLVHTVERVQTEIREIKVPVYIPTPKQSKAIEKEIGGKIPSGDLLGIHEIKPSETGSKIVITQDEPGNPLTVTVFPNKPKLFQWEFRQRSVEAWTNVDTLRLDAEFRSGLFRVGPVHVGLRVKADNLTRDPLKPAIQIGARYTF